MAVLISGADGNFTNAATWRLVDATSYLDSEAGATGLTTSYTYSQPFVPGAITIDAVAVKIRNQSTTTTGTWTLGLQNQTDVVYVEEMTANVADVPTAPGGSDRVSWYVWKLSAPATLIAGKSYRIGLKSSVAGRFILLRGAAGTTDWSRMLRTTTTQAPAADDQLHIAGEFGPNSSAVYTVIMDNTAATTFGPAVASAAQGITVNYNGVLTWGTAAATSYLLRWRNRFNINEGGTVNIGTAGTPIPADSSAILDMVNAAAGDTGIEVWHGTFNIYGADRKNTVTRLNRSVGGWCKTEGTAVTALSGSQSFLGLTGSIVINTTTYTISSVTDATHLTLTGSAGNISAAYWKHPGTAASVQVDTTGGWSSGDVLCFAPSILRLEETGTISVVNNGSELTLGSALGNMHYGAEPMRVPVGLLTHNVKIRGSNKTLTGYVALKQYAVCVWRNAEFYWIGRNGNPEYGITCGTTGGSLDMQHCSVHDCAVASSTMLHFTTDAQTATVSRSVFYQGRAGVRHDLDVTGSHRYEGNFICAMNGGAGAYTRNGADSVWIGNFVAGCDVAFESSTEQSGSIASSEVFCGTGAGLCYANGVATTNNIISTLTFEGCKVVCCPSGVAGTAVDSSYGAANLVVNNGTFIAVNRVFPFGDDNSYTVQVRACKAYRPIYVAYAYKSAVCPAYSANALFEDCAFTGSATETTYVPDEAVLTYAAGWTGAVTFSNCTFPPSAALISQISTSTRTLTEARRGSVNVQRYNGTVGANGRYNVYGTAFTDAIIFAGSTSPLSVRLTPLPGSILQGAWVNAVVSNGASLTVAVQTRESVVSDGTDYNGSRPGLWVLQNAAAGINADTLLATATSAGSGTWAALSGVVGPVTDNAVLRFCVAVGGTACTRGWVNVDVATFSADTNASAFTFWNNTGETFAANVYGAESSSGGGGGAWTFIG